MSKDRTTVNICHLEQMLIYLLSVTSFREDGKHISLTLAAATLELNIQREVKAAKGQVPCSDR